MISPQSQSVLDRLDKGERVTSGSESVGPLDVPTRLLLRLLVEESEVLKRETGPEQARKLRELYVDAKSASAQQADDATGEGGIDSDGSPAVKDGASESSGEVQTVAARQPVVEEQPARWRLHHLTCQGFRGVDPSGKPLDFPFNGLPTLIYGPNGSGKSSLLGAITWVLTGRIITDADDNAEHATLYGVPRAGDSRGAKIRDWPVVATLPDASNPASTTPKCSAELQLQSSVGTPLWVRRSLSDGLETSHDGSTWTSCGSLVQHGIEPLDLQLSLIAPTVFGRLTIERADDTRSLLSLMLGYDELEALGDFVSKIAGNRTRLETHEQNELDTKWTELQQKLESLPGNLPKDSDLRKRLDVLAATKKPTQEAISEIGKAVKMQIKTAETNLASLLGIVEEGEDASPPDGLADKLTTVIAGLEKGVWGSFPSLSAIRIEVALPEKDGEDAKARFAGILKESKDLLSSFKTKIAQRLEWWRKEVEPASKVALLLRAAQDYDPQAAQCPVCDQSIKHLPVKDELTALKELDPELQIKIQVFFRNLLDELKVIVPDKLIALTAPSPPERILQDWKLLCDETIGPTFKAVTALFKSRIEQIADDMPAVAEIEIHLLPEDAEDGFVEAASEFVEKAEKAYKALATIEWGVSNLEKVQQSLNETITRVDGGDATSLLVALSKGKLAAAEIEPLSKVRDELRAVYKIREAITLKEDDLRVLKELATGLEKLKPLSKYAANEVSTVFGSIRDKTIENWWLLYPEKSSLDPARLVMGKGRDKTVEAFLGCGNYEVPGKHFANAGLQRAIVLSFFFALLEEHPSGLGFVVMDDPILSLDEDHRESWSANLLTPAMRTTQIILATHQRQYLNHNGHDFREGTVVELNLRCRAGRVSWRPGFHLDRAQQHLDGAWTSAPNEMRMYREQLLCTLDAYSPAPFNVGNFAQSLSNYIRLTPPHPLAGPGQARILGKLNDIEVTRVLDPGSHHLTQSDVTAPMCSQCLSKLRECNNKLWGELDRLDRLRAHARRGKALPALVEGPLGIPESASWNDPIGIRLLGRAAAKSDSWVCDESENSSGLTLPPGVAVVASAGTLEPVVRVGQWLLTAPEDVTIKDGDLVIAVVGERRLLRRAWADGTNWQLASINPVRPDNPVIAPLGETRVRKIWGVLYEPLRICTGNNEWQPRDDFDPAWLAPLHAIAVEGESLEPLARRGQHVLVASRQSVEETTLSQGELAVLETSDDGVGNVIKRVYRRDDQWILVSPNPVEPPEPILLPAEVIIAVWPLRGVLFESTLASES